MADHSRVLQHLPLEGEVIPAARQAGKSKNAKRAQKSKSCVVREATWRYLISLVSQGVGTQAAIKQAKVSKQVVEGYLRTDAEAKAQWEDAKTAALWLNWDLEMVEDIMADIAMGTTVKAAVTARAFETGNHPVHSFYKLLTRDEFVKEMYDEARKLQAEKMAIDDILEISDDDSNDETVDGKGNAAAVNRARLKVQSRQWIAGRMNFKRFGDKKQVDLEANIIVDHAARLEEARRRKEQLNSKKEKKS